MLKLRQQIRAELILTGLILACVFSTTNSVGAETQDIELSRPVNGERELTAYKGEVPAVAVAADGKTTASGTSGHGMVKELDVRIHDLETGKLLRTFTLRHQLLTSLALSPDAGADGLVKTWPLKALPQNLSLPRVLTLNKPVKAAAYFPDNRRIAIGAGDTVTLWDTQTQTAKTLTADGLDINSVAVSPDGLTVAVGATIRQDAGEDEDNVQSRMLLWDVKTHQLRHTVDTGDVRVTNLSFSPDSKTLVICDALSFNRPINDPGAIVVGLWDVEGGQFLSTVTVPRPHHNLIAAVAFSPDNFTIACTSWHGVYIIDRQTGKVKTEFTHLAPVVGTTATSFFSAVGFSLDGTKLICGSAKTLQRWDVATGGLELSINYATEESRIRTTSTAITPNGMIFASAIKNPTNDEPPSYGQLSLFDTTNGFLLGTITNRSSSITAVAFSPDGKTIATNYGENAVRLWPIEALSPERAE